jgi:RNA polymerase sigma factor (sigma-70 family)
MPKQPLNGVLQQLRKVAAVQTCQELSDRDLLERFVSARDDAAFTVLIERHGPMVLGVCQRALPNFHDAEDACQATFLVLARKAASVRKKTSLSTWLHGVACRVAANVKRGHARRKSREHGLDVPAPKDPAAEVTWREVQTILDDELQRLPERYRAPMILCYLECLTREDAAKQLGLSPTTLHGRLERAREVLRKSLTRRGLTLGAAMSSAALGESLAHAALAPTFVISSTRAAMLLAAGQPLTDGVVTTPVLALTQEVLKTMFLTKLKLGTAAALCAGLFVAIIAGSIPSLSIAQDATPGPLAPKKLERPENPESDADFIRRISKDLRGTEPTPAEIHFFVTSKDAGRRQKLIDLFIQERQARAEESKRNRLGVERDNTIPAYQPAAERDAKIQLHGPEAKTDLATLQIDFYKELHAAKDKGDVARITQSYLDRLIDFEKTYPKSQFAPDVIRQIVLVYESQGKTAEAAAWGDKLKLPREDPKAIAPNMSDNSSHLFQYNPKHKSAKDMASALQEAFGNRDVKITYDEKNNTLYIRASELDILTSRKILSDLDVAKTGPQPAAERPGNPNELPGKRNQPRGYPNESPGNRNGPGVLEELSQPPAGGSREVESSFAHQGDAPPGQTKYSARFIDSVELSGTERPGKAAILGALSRPPAGVSRDVDSILIEQVKPGLWKCSVYHTESVLLPRRDDQPLNSPILQVVGKVLDRANALDLYSLGPRAPGEPGDANFHGWSVLGKTEVKNETLAKLVAAFKKGAEEQNQLDPTPPGSRLFETFSPRYGIRVQIEGKLYDFAISFEQKTVVLFTNTDKSPEAFWISKTPAAVFNTILN